VLWVYRLDRLTRSGIRDTLQLLHELRARGCVVRSVADGLPDMDGPLGEVLVAVLAWTAQVERQMIRERQAVARARLEASGRNWGRPKRLDAKKLAWLRRELGKGRSVRDLVSASGLSESTIRRALKSE
jgi:DNA invertase Pin-like site-specific DNA recombinase